MRFLIVFLTVLLCLAGVGSVYGAMAWSSPVPTNESTVYTNVINYSIAYTNGTNVTACNISISITSSTAGFTNYTATQCTTTIASYYVDGQTFHSTSRQVWYKFMVDNGSEVDTWEESGVYYFTVSSWYSIYMILRAMPSVIGAYVGLIVWVGVIVIILGIIAWIKGWFGNKGLGGILDFKKIKS